jgi:AraC-like DNA-binding protein
MQTEQKAIIYTSQKQSLYVGKLERHLKRANVSSTLFVSLEDDLELLDARGEAIARSKSFLVPSGIDLSLDTHHAKVAMFFLDEFGLQFNKLIQDMTGAICTDQSPAIYCGSKLESEIIEHASFISHRRPSESDVSELLNHWLNKEPTHYSGHIYDERVAMAAALIKDHSHLNMSVAEIADKVNLSVPRLIQLFKQVTGTPIRRFRLWHRIFATAEKLSKGISLTEAAIASGFSDYAHFSRTYRELSGGNPSQAKENTEIRVMAS